MSFSSEFGYSVSDVRFFWEKPSAAASSKVARGLSSLCATAPMNNSRRYPQKPSENSVSVPGALSDFREARGA